LSALALGNWSQFAGMASKGRKGSDSYNCSVGQRSVMPPSPTLLPGASLQAYSRSDASPPAGCGPSRGVWGR